MNNRIYFTNEVHDELIGKASLLMMQCVNHPDSHQLALEIHQTLLSEFYQDEEREIDYSGEDH